MRRRELALEDLYLQDGCSGWNWSAVGATAPRMRACLERAGLALALRPLYDYAWFVGFLVAGGTYLAFAPGQRGQLAAARSRVR